MTKLTWLKKAAGILFSVSMLVQTAFSSIPIRAAEPNAILGPDGNYTNATADLELIVPEDELDEGTDADITLKWTITSLDELREFKEKYPDWNPEIEIKLEKPESLTILSGLTDEITLKNNNTVQASFFLFEKDGDKVEESFKLNVQSSENAELKANFKIGDQVFEARSKVLRYKELNETGPPIEDSEGIDQIISATDQSINNFKQQVSELPTSREAETYTIPQLIELDQKVQSLYETFLSFNKEIQSALDAERLVLVQLLAVISGSTTLFRTEAGYVPLDYFKISVPEELKDKVSEAQWKLFWASQNGFFVDPNDSEKNENVNSGCFPDATMYSALKGYEFKRVTIGENGEPVKFIGIVPKYQADSGYHYYYLAGDGVDGDSSQIILKDNEFFYVHYDMVSYAITYKVEINNKIPGSDAEPKYPDKILDFGEEPISPSIRTEEGHAQVVDQVITSRSPESIRGAYSFTVIAPDGYTAEVFREVYDENGERIEEDCKNLSRSSDSSNNLGNQRKAYPLGTELVFKRGNPFLEVDADNGPQKYITTDTFYDDNVQQERTIIVKLERKPAPTLDGVIWSSLGNMSGRITFAYDDKERKEEDGNLIPVGNWDLTPLKDRKLDLKLSDDHSSYSYSFCIQTNTGSQGRPGFVFDSFGVNGTDMEVPLNPKELRHADPELFEFDVVDEVGYKSSIKLPDGIVVTIEFLWAFNPRNATQRVYRISFDNVRSNIVLTAGNFMMYGTGAKDLQIYSLYGVNDGSQIDTGTFSVQYYPKGPGIDDWVSANVNQVLVDTGSPNMWINYEGFDQYNKANIRFKLDSGYDYPSYSLTYKSGEVSGNQESSTVIDFPKDGSELSEQYIYKDEDGWYYISLKGQEDKKIALLKIEAIQTRYFLQYDLVTNLSDIKPNKDIFSENNHYHVHEEDCVVKSNDSAKLVDLDLIDDNLDNFYIDGKYTTISFAESPTDLKGFYLFNDWIIDSEDGSETHFKAGKGVTLDQLKQYGSVFKDKCLDENDRPVILKVIKVKANWEKVADQTYSYKIFIHWDDKGSYTFDQTVYQNGSIGFPEDIEPIVFEDENSGKEYLLYISFENRLILLQSEYINFLEKEVETGNYVHFNTSSSVLKNVVNIINNKFLTEEQREKGWTYTLDFIANNGSDAADDYVYNLNDGGELVIRLKEAEHDEGGLSITKAVKAAGLLGQGSFADTFPFTLSLYDGDQPYSGKITSRRNGLITYPNVENGTIEFNIKDGEKIDFFNIPSGLKFSVKEKVETIDGNDNSIKGSDGLIYQLVSENNQAGVVPSLGNIHSLAFINQLTLEPPQKSAQNLNGDVLTEDHIVTPGEIIKFTINWSNYSMSTQSVVVSDVLDPNLDFIEASDPGEYDPLLRKITWDLGLQNSGSHGGVTLTAKVNETISEEGSVNNIAGVKIGNNPEVKTNPVSFETWKPIKEWLNRSESVAPGEKINYSISWKNFEQSKSSIKIVDQLDQNVTFVSADMDDSDIRGSYDPSAHSVIWELGEREPEESGTVELEVAVKAYEDWNKQAQSFKDGIIRNKADVNVGDKSLITNEVESPTINKPTKVRTDPNGDLQENIPVKIGDVVTYRIAWSWKNETGQVAEVKIIDELSSGLKYEGVLNDTPTPNDVSANRIEWVIQVAEGEEVNVDYLVQAKVVEESLEVNNEGKVSNAISVELNGFSIPGKDVESSVVNPPEKTTQSSRVYPGEIISYKISWTNTTAGLLDLVTIKDKLPEELQYVSYETPYSDSQHSFNQLADGTLIWIFKNIQSGQTIDIDLKTQVSLDAEADSIIKNAASVRIGNNGVEVESESTETTVSQKEEKPTSPDEPVDPGKPENPSTGGPEAPNNNTGNSPGTSSTPDLLIKDHYAYIIGRNYQYAAPNESINRDEVTTIFFRLLTDEARNKYWSTSNNYPDVLSDVWHNNAISTMTKLGVVQGYDDGLFRPSQAMTRAELAKVAVSFFPQGSVSTAQVIPTFSDINGHWAEEYIRKAAAAGLIQGYTDGTYRPEQPISRAEAMSIINRLLGRRPHKEYFYDEKYQITWPDNQDKNEWYYEIVQEATNSHTHTFKDSDSYETWVDPLEVRDWAAFEKMWADANASKNPGEVIN